MHAQQYRGLVAVRVGASCRSATAFTLGHNTIFVSRLESPAARIMRRVACAQRRIVAHCCAVSQPWRVVSQPKVAPLSHDTKFVSRPSPGQAMHAAHCCTPCAHADHIVGHIVASSGRVMVCLGRIVACLGRIVACLGRIVAKSPTRLLHAVLPHQALCHDTLHCIVTQHRKMGSSPFNCLLSIFFFHHFFSTYWKTIKRIFFLFPNRTKQIH